MDELDKLRNELSNLAADYKARAERAYRKQHLNQQDHEMFNRIFDQIAKEDSVPLRDRVITVARVNRNVSDAQVIRRISSNDSKGGTRSVSDRVYRRRKNKPVLPSANADALQGLQSRLRNLMDE